MLFSWLAAALIVIDPSRPRNVPVRAGITPAADF
jgi:hypothetical protein